MKQILTIVLAVLALPGVARAADAGRFSYKLEATPQEGPVDPKVDARYTRAFDSCQKAAVSTPAMVACSTQEFARQDKVLNSVWKISLRRVPAGQRAELVAAQRQWIAARDPFCKAQTTRFSGGTIAPVIYAGCRVEQTIRRTLWLEWIR